MTTQPTPPQPDTSRCYCTSLRQASRRLSQMYDVALAPSGLKTTQRAVLAQIKRSEPATVKALADALVMEAGGLAHTLKPLERDGLVSISVDPTDRRSRRIVLTAAGRAKLAESDALWEAAHARFESAYGVEQAASLREAMRMLISGEFMATFERDAGESGQDHP